MLDPGYLNQWFLIFLAVFMNMMIAQTQTPLPLTSADWESQEVQEAPPQDETDEGREAVNTDPEDDNNTILHVMLIVLGCLLVITIMIVIVRIYRKRSFKQGMQRLRNIDTDDETDDEHLVINTDGI